MYDFYTVNADVDMKDEEVLQPYPLLVLLLLSITCFSLPGFEFDGQLDKTCALPFQGTR